MSVRVQTTIPQQQMVVIQQTHAGSSPSRAREYDTYQTGQSKGLGITQIVLGILAIVANSVAIYFENDGYGDGLSYSAMGYWAGFWFILTGGFGISAGSNKTTCTITAFMVLSILCICTLNIVYLGLSAAGVSLAVNHECTFFGIFSYDCGRENHGLVATMACLLAICLVEFVVAIWAIVICSNVICCGPAPMSPAQHVFYANSGNPNVTIIPGPPGYSAPGVGYGAQPYTLYNTQPAFNPQLGYSPQAAYPAHVYSGQEGASGSAPPTVSNDPPPGYGYKQ